MEILYTTSAIRNAIRKLFGDPSRRRVAIVAFVGSDAEAYLPYPQGLELVCWPKAGATDANVISRLLKRGAVVKFSDNLHMKVYWAAGKGAIITSANLSDAALGSERLKEIGIKLPAKSVDVDRLISQAKPRDVERSELSKLIRISNSLPRTISNISEKQKTFMDWYGQGQADPWLVGWTDGNGNMCRNAKAESRTRFGVPHPHDFIGCADGDYPDNSFVLRFFIDHRNHLSQFNWLQVDFTVHDERLSRRVHYSSQAVQVFRKRNGIPPFKLDSAFRAAFKKAAVEYGVDAIHARTNTKPPKRLIDLIAKHYANSR